MRAFFALSLIVPLTFLGCASSSDDRVTLVSVGSAPRAAAGMQTYSWAPGATMVPTETRLDAEALEMELRRAIRDVMSARGYRFVEPGAADRHVAYAIGLSRVLDSETLRRTFGFDPGSPYSDDEHGTLVIAIVDPRSGTPLYRASIQAVVHPDASASRRQARIQGAVETLLATVPATSP